MLRRRQYRGGGALALSGAVLLLAGTWLHPASADANDPVAAFSQYADTSRPVWVTAHLIQFAGLAAMILAIVVLSGAGARHRGRMGAHDRGPRRGRARPGGDAAGG